MRTIPFVDLKKQYDAIRDDVDAAIKAVIENSEFVRGRFVSLFETHFADALGARHFVGMGNGTDALYIALKALGIGIGDEVITAANSWIASSECITRTGASVVFADVDSQTYTLDVSDVRSKVTSRTKAIIPVHLYGQPADMAELQVLGRSKDVSIVEDCAQAHFAEIRGSRVGTMGDAGAFSFYPSKNLGAFGDAGGVSSDNDDLTRFMRSFANHGSTLHDKHKHDLEGVNSRLDGIQAAVLEVKLRSLENWTIRRRYLAKLYDELLDGIGDIVSPKVAEGRYHVYHVYCIRTSRRNELRDYLEAAGVGTAVHYPKALPFLGAYAYLGHTPSDFPVSHRLQRESLSLPIYPELSEGEIAYICETIERFFKRHPT